MLGDGEILALVYGLEEGESELQMSGFEFINMVDYGLKYEGMLPTCSYIVVMR